MAGDTSYLSISQVKSAPIAPGPVPMAVLAAIFA